MSKAVLLLSLACVSLVSGCANHPHTVSATVRTMTAHLASTVPQLTLSDRDAGVSITIPELFAVTLKDGSTLESTALHWDSPFTASGQQPQQTCAALSDPKTGAHFRWCLMDSSHGEYMREQLTISAGRADLPIADVRLLSFRDSGAHVIGTVKGSPLADSHMFFGFESPLSWSRALNGNAEAGIARELPLRANQSVTYSAVIGSYPPGQLRRAFLAYLSDERPRAYSPFLNYNTWYDIGYTNRYSEADALNRIHAFGTELVTKRHVQLNSFVFDDGWDNPNSFWSFDSGFPDGFTRVAAAARGYGAGIGVWLSPWGGYDEQKTERIAYGKAHGYEMINDGYALSGPKYFRGFSDVCSDMVQKYDVNLFKFDGTGNSDRVFPGSIFDSDFAAAIHLIRHLREEKPGIFINLTTGTYPSPFWLFYADSIWRGGEDHSFAGVGMPRQRWMTYRDAQTYHNIVLGGPLFPLNSLMLHGMIYAQKADGLDTDPGNDFPSEILSYFGSGTQLQEMYVTPSLLSRHDWDVLARAANWSRQHSDILEDTHWIGGDPAKLQVYGWAAWSPKGWIITLRNPSNHPQSYSVDLAKALELPAGAAGSFQVTQPFASTTGAAQHWTANQPVSISLQPFQVLIFESGS